MGHSMECLNICQLNMPLPHWCTVPHRTHWASAPGSNSMRQWHVQLALHCWMHVRHQMVWCATASDWSHTSSTGWNSLSTSGSWQHRCRLWQSKCLLCCRPGCCCQHNQRCALWHQEWACTMAMNRARPQSSVDHRSSNSVQHICAASLGAQCNMPVSQQW